MITGALDDWIVRAPRASSPGRWRSGAPQREAGITDYKYIDWFREHPLEDDLKLLRWSDEQLAGKGYIDWYPFEHPQLGPVEIGGWNDFYAFRIRRRSCSNASWRSSPPG